MDDATAIVPNEMAVSTEIAFEKLFVALQTKLRTKHEEVHELFREAWLSNKTAEHRIAVCARSVREYEYLGCLAYNLKREFGLPSQDKKDIDNVG